jgi:monoamine oxidase
MKNENKNLITRRGFLSLGAVMAGSTLLSGCANNQPQKDEVIKPTSKKLKETLLPKGDKKRVVIVGGGISGMYVANGIR